MQIIRRRKSLWICDSGEPALYPSDRTQASHSDRKSRLPGRPLIPESEGAPNETRVVRRLDDGVYALDHAGGCRIGASVSRLPSRHGRTELISTPRKRPSGMRTLTKRGPTAFPAPSSPIPSASTCLAPASSFCGRSFQTRITSFRSSSRAAESPGARVILYGSDLGAYCVLPFS
jgi:hypothetical protein